MDTEMRQMQETNFLMESSINAARLADAIDEVEAMISAAKNATGLQEEGLVK